jgi:hypothetical protein
VTRLFLGGLGFAVMLAAACAPASTPPSELAYTHESAHFIFHHGGADQALMPAIAGRVEAEFFRVASDLGALGMRRVQVYFHESHDALAAAVEPVTGPIPVWATGLVTAADRIHILSPRVMGQSEVAAAAAIVHEFAHCATLAVHPSSANNPRWLWEAVALFEARERIDPRMLGYMVNGAYPTLSELNVINDRRIYEVGYLLGEFIVAQWHLEGLRALIRSGGQLEATFGVTAREFETVWVAFVREKYSF